MTVSEIIKQVRLCIDEESNNTSSMAEVIDEKDDSYMDNIIEAKIPDALHWLAVTAASSSVLSSSSSTTDSSTTDSSTTELKVKAFEDSTTIGVITMPSNISVFNINRVRGYGWYKAVVPVEDTSDEACYMYDTNAMGTEDRPLAAIMRVSPLQILIQPIPSNKVVTVSYVGIPTGTTKDSESGTESVELSDTFKSAFIYYIAFLLLSAYDDSSKASQMYSIALQQLGVSQSK